MRQNEKKLRDELSAARKLADDRGVLMLAMRYRIDRLERFVAALDQWSFHGELGDAMLEAMVDARKELRTETGM